MTGKPTAPQPATEYTYTVTDGDATDPDKDSVTFTIAIVPDLIPTLSSVPDQTYVTGKKIETLQLPPAVGGDGSLTYSLSPALHGGLSFDSTARTITGTPNALPSGTNSSTVVHDFTVTDSDSEDPDTGSTSFNITIVRNLTPSLGNVSSETLTADRDSLDKQLPAATGGNLPLTYALVGSLPAGLTYNPATRKITGTPTSTQGATEYTYRVTDADGDTSEKKFNITVNANFRPSFSTASLNPRYVVNVPIAPLQLPTASSGNGNLTYTLSPNITRDTVPTGLVYDASTKQITGTPTELGITTHAYTAEDEDGDTFTVFVTIHVIRDLDVDNDGLIEIYTKAQLNAMRWDLNGDGDAEDDSNQNRFERAFAPTLQGGSHECAFPANSDLTECNGFELMNPLTYSKSESFTPVGHNRSPFIGNFNGNGQGIDRDGMQFFADYYNGEVMNAGLFGVNGTESVIENVNIVGGSASAWTWNWKDNTIGNAGMIVGINKGTIKNSAVNGEGEEGGGRVIGSTSAGMVVGINEGDILNTYVVSGNVLGGEASGLFAGRNVVTYDEHRNERKALIKNTYSHGWRSETKWKHQKIGAHVGRNFGNIDESYTVGLSKYRSSTRFGPLNGQATSTGDVDNSYFISDSKRHERYGGTRKTLEQLQAPTSKSGIYNNWTSTTVGDVLVWHFGTSTQLPALKADWNGDGTATVCEFGGSAQGRATSCPGQ